MRAKLLLAFIIVFGVTSCETKQQKNTISLTAKELYDSAIILSTKGDSISRASAINLLNKVTTIDSNYYQAYFDKLPLLLGFKNYNRALLEIDDMLRLKPSDPDLNVTHGILCEYLGDTINSRKSFLKALKLYDLVLDTIPQEYDRHLQMLLSKAVCLILLKEEGAGQEILKRIYSSDMDDRLRKAIESVLNKSRKDILESSL